MQKRKKILTVVGARPQFVKAAAVSPLLSQQPDIEEVLVHTGQHFDDLMSDVFFRELRISSPKVNLGIGGGTHGENTGRMIEALENVLVRERPDAVMVYGDTDSTLAAALATAKLAIPLAHVEAGLRSYRRGMPEEINRVVADHIADVLYAPTATAAANLAREGVPDSRVVVTGDVMFDAVRMFSARASAESRILDRVRVQPREYFVLTLHRKENTEQQEVLQRIFAGLAQCALPVIFPVHPRTRRRIEAFSLKLPECIRAIEPLGYLDTLRLLGDAKKVLTDSGGVQKEAYFLGRPCVTLRDETEWIELIKIGANTLAGSNTELIAHLLTIEADEIQESGLFGDAHAADIIAADLVGRIAS